MRVAVIIPLYRAEGFVAATIASVRAQTHRDVECVVVDDGSPDASAQVAAEAFAGDPRFRLLRQANAGSAAARNTGLAAVSAAAEAVAFLDADDTWLPDALEVLVAGLRAHPGAVGAYGTAEFIDERGEPVHPGVHGARELARRRVDGWRLSSVDPRDPVGFDEAVVMSQLWPPAMVLHRRALVDAVGGFDAAIRYVDDWDLVLRMTRHGDYSPLGRQVAWYRLHAGQLTNQTASNAYFHDVLRRATWQSPANSPAQRRAATVAWRNLQVRRTVRCAQACARAARRGELGGAARLALGTVVLAAQNLRTSPPPARAWLAAIAARTTRRALPGAQ